MTNATDASVFKTSYTEFTAGDLYKIDKYHRVIHPAWNPFDNTSEAMLDWARQYRDFYDVYTVGYITYHSDEALSFFLLRWSC